MGKQKQTREILRYVVRELGKAIENEDIWGIKIYATNYMSYRKSIDTYEKKFWDYKVGLLTERLSSVPVEVRGIAV